MGEVVHVSFPKNTGAQERNRARVACHRNGDNFRFRNLAEPICDLTMGRTDPEDTAPCEMSPNDEAH